MKGSSDTRQKLIDVTRNMIDAGGIDSLSMRDLGTEMNLSRSAVYRHFKSKNELLRAVIDENFDRARVFIQNLSCEEADAKQLIYRILCGFYNFGIHNPDHYRLMFRTGWYADGDADLHESAAGAFRIFEDCVGSIQRQGHAPGKPPKQLTAMIAAFIIGLIDLNDAGHMEAEKGFDDPNGLIGSFLDTVLA